MKSVWKMWIIEMDRIKKNIHPTKFIFKIKTSSIVDKIMFIMIMIIQPDSFYNFREKKV